MWRRGLVCLIEWNQEFFAMEELGESLLTCVAI